jgi:prevent-host-death family protein
MRRHRSASRSDRLTNLTNTAGRAKFFLMADRVNIYDAKSRLSELVDRAAAGEEIVIAKAGKPRARLGPLTSPKVRRKPGGGKGKVWVAADFDSPLPPELLAGFSGKHR